MSNNTPKLTINFQGEVINIHPTEQRERWLVTLSNGENLLKFEYEGTPPYQIWDQLRVTGEVRIDMKSLYDSGQLSIIDRNSLGFSVTKLHSVNFIKSRA